MKVSELIELWERDGGGEPVDESYSICLPVEDAARIEALAEIYPRLSREQLITGLLAAALDQVVAGFPYIQGEQVIATDEEGDPVFEDVGHTPRYLALVHKHVERLRGQRD